ncbi:tRNA wybutosine-synthesizing protein 2 [Methanomicrobium sp. W14]|uniref:class I SAM-dependent methyltransferase n=1 Tax=Methanomicrobium sp. W14 TaxID=2817839 RepID=UPI001AE98679|nr:SAM-dependent methyltransferase [Methanomicrobium sp. W14]MBP2132239.1 tRNA wybutosine-synthesizing protein 2 [Methanomicrobium sp. W14]
MRSRIIPTENLGKIKGQPWVDRTRRPFVKESLAWVPVKKGYAADCILDEKKGYCGTGYQMTGDTALIHGDAPSEEKIKELIEWKKPSCILHIINYSGEMRIPQAEVLYGSPHEVCHRENGCTFFFDPSKVMFAMGNREEKRRMSGIVKKGERIADMFAGIGYFTIPAAMAGARVHAMEINPQSFEYLKKNIIKNGVPDTVFPECGDCRKLLKGTYDRIFMGHFDSPSMLADALSHSETGSVLHVHSIDSVREKIILECKNAGFYAEITEHKVKKYAPHRWHVVEDVELI